MRLGVSLGGSITIPSSSYSNQSYRTTVLARISSKQWESVGLAVQVISSGFVVMALEIVGSRLITPAFGNSTFTWGSLIGMVLAGLAMGYYLGGRLADLSGSKALFSAVLFSGGLLVIMVPFVSPYVLEASLGLGLQYGPLLASGLILVLPTTVLGMTSPYAIKIAARSLVQLGRISGNLYSLSTVGSILGAFGATFVLIPSLDLRTIIFALGLSLIMASLIWLPIFPKILSLVVVVLLFTPISGSLSGALIHAGSVLYEKETPYSHLDVVDSGSQRTLYLNSLPHSAMDLNDPNRLVFTYTRYFHLGPVLNSQAANVLFVGGGGFSGPKSFLSTYPSITVDVVEIDPDVIATAQRYFNLVDSPRLTVFNLDARVYLSGTYKMYDVIILDAYAKSYVPFHLMTQEFMQLLRERLTPQGIIVSNLIGSLFGDSSDLVRAELKTAATIFPNTAVFTTASTSGGVQNLMLLFAEYPSPTLNDAVTRHGTDGPGIPLLPGDFQAHLYRSTILVDDVPVLTDLYAPVETLLNPVTGQPYVIEQTTGRLPLSTFQASSPLVFTGIVVATMVWFAYLFRLIPIAFNRKIEEQ